LRGTPLSLATRNKCNVGYFCPEGTASSNALTTKCPRRTFSLNGASRLINCRIEEVDVCDKKDFGLDNPFEHISYYSKHSYSLLDDDGGSVVEFDSTREKNPTGEIEVLRKINPVNATSSSKMWVNDTVEVFRTCPPYGIEDSEDYVTVIGRNFRDSDFLTCRFTACLQSNIKALDPYYHTSPRTCRDQYGQFTDELSLMKVTGKAEFISSTRVRCKVPRYDFNSTGGYQYMEAHDRQGRHEYGAGAWPGSGFDSSKDYDIEGNWNDYPDPEKTRATRPDYNGFQGKCKRDQDGIVYYLQYCSDNPVQGSKCVPDDYVAIDGSDSTGNTLHMKLYSMVIACTRSEVSSGFCENVPEFGQRMNPCYTGQMLVEVSNNGDKFSGDGLKYLHSTVENPSNRLDLEIEPTYATYTFISREKSVIIKEEVVGGSAVTVLKDGFLDENNANYDQNATVEFEKVLQMDKYVCNRPIHAEEGIRDKEIGWYELPFLNYAQLSFDFRNLPSDMVYDEHYKVAIYASPSRCLSENCNSNRIRQAPKEELPCMQPMDLPQWFTDPRVNKNQVMNLTMLALDDSLVKVEVHIVHGSFMASSEFLKETLTVQITKPNRAFENIGQEKIAMDPNNPTLKPKWAVEDRAILPEMRRKSPFISWEEQAKSMEYFFGIVYEKDNINDISPPLNLPPRYEDFSKGRILISMNTTNDSRNYYCDGGDCASIDGIDQEGSEYSGTWMDEGGSDSYYTPTILQDFEDLRSDSGWWDNPFNTYTEAKENTDMFFETFHGSFLDGDTFTWDFTELVLPYLPFFSNCREFDSYIPFWALLESPKCELPDMDGDSPSEGESYLQYLGESRWNLPALPHVDDIVVVGPFDFFTFTPVADYCTMTVYCDYEEKLEQRDTVPRWMEVQSGNDLFTIIRRPISYFEYVGRKTTRTGLMDDGGKTIMRIIGERESSDTFIGVSVDRDEGNSVPGGCAELCFPREMSLAIDYYQRSAIEKQIVAIELSYGAFDFNQKRTDYSLSLEFRPLNYMELIIKFAYDSDIFIYLFLAIGVATVTLTFFYWVVVRLTTQLESPPRLRFYGMVGLVCPNAFGGFGLAMTPIIIVTMACCLFLRGYNIFGAMPFGAALPGFKSDGRDWWLGTDWTLHYMEAKPDPRDLERGQKGRMGLAFVVMSAMCINEGCKIFLPKRVSKREKSIELKRDKNAEKDAIWIPTLWKRSNLIYTSFMMGLFLLIIVEFSFWGDFGTYIWEIIILLKVLAQSVGSVVDNQLNEALLSAPIGTAMGLIQGMVTLSADDFMDFLFSYIVEFGFLIMERMYTDPGQGAFFDWLDEFLADLMERIARRLPKFMTNRMNAGKEEKTDAEKSDREKEIEGMIGDGAETVEPILDSFGSYCCDTMSLLYTPFNIVLLMMFREETGIPDLYGIKEQDMLYYLLFALLIVPFQLTADILIHSCQELFHGWKIYDYLIYTRYRFLQRETRWKGLEDSLDECIDESMRTMDQMCFSSQFYMMMTIHVNGIMYFILGVEMMIRSEYNLFGDPAMMAIVSFTVSVSLLTKWFLVKFGSRTPLWRIKHENTAWHTTIADEDDFDLPGWDDMKGASHDAYLMNQRITSETFRYKFLNYNRAWLINQLPSILTPRTLRRSRPYLINQFTRILNALNQDISSDSDRDDGPKFGIPILSAPTRKLVRWWLNKAQRRLKLREVVQPLINKNRGTQCEQCLSRKLLQVEIIVPIEEMDERFVAENGDEEFDQVLWKNFWTKHQRYRTLCLGCISQRLEKERRAALAGAMKDDSDDDEGMEYPEWGPIYLNAASKAILMGWYKTAQNRLFGKGGRRRKRVQIDVSDDEGEDVPAEWAQAAVNLSESSKAIAIKWVRTARSKLQKDKGFEERARENRVTRAKPGEKYKSGKKSKTRRK